MSENKRELSNQELNNVSGGDSALNVFDLRRATSSVKNSKGCTVGEYIEGTLYYQPCHVCKKPMRLDVLYWECTEEGHTATFAPTIVPWPGTEEELKAASL